MTLLDCPRAAAGRADCRLGGSGRCSFGNLADWLRDSAHDAIVRWTTLLFDHMPPWVLEGAELCSQVGAPS